LVPVLLMRRMRICWGEEEAAAITLAKAKTAIYIRKIPKKKSTFGCFQTRRRNKKSLVIHSRVASSPPVIAESTPSPSSRQQLVRTITQLQKTNADLATELAAMKHGMVSMLTESQRIDGEIKRLKMHNQTDRKAVNDHLQYGLQQINLMREDAIEKTKVADKAVIQNTRDMDKRILAGHSSVATRVETTGCQYHSSLTRERQAVDDIVAVKAAEVKKLQTALADSHQSHVEASKALELSKHDMKRKIEHVTTKASIELKSAEWDMKRKHSSEVLEKKSVVASLKKTRRLDMASTEEDAREATNTANEARKKA